MSIDQPTNAKGATSTGIITRAQERCHRARSAYLEARQFANGDVNWPIHHEFQASVMEYYEALRPLREEPPVEGFWQDAVLWTVIDGWEQRQDERGRVVGYEPVEKEVTGFENLQARAIAIDTGKKAVSDSFGPRTVEVSESQLMDGEILLNVSHLLDDAAKRLGFAPDIEAERSELYKIMNPEDYDEPVKDGIEKPQ